LIDGVAPKRFAGMNICHQFWTNVLSGFPANLMLRNDSGLSMDYRNKWLFKMD